MLTVMAKKNGRRKIRADIRKNMSDWAKQLRAIRARLDITQEQAATKLGISVHTLIGWENSTRIPSEFVQKQVLAVLQSK